MTGVPVAPQNPTPQLIAQNQPKTEPEQLSFWVFWPPPPHVHLNTLHHCFTQHALKLSWHTQFPFFFGPSPSPSCTLECAPSPSPLPFPNHPTTSPHHPTLLFDIAHQKLSLSSLVSGFWPQPLLCLTICECTTSPPPLPYTSHPTISPHHSSPPLDTAHLILSPSGLVSGF
jgi:hypothetical protein